MTDGAEAAAEAPKLPPPTPPKTPLWKVLWPRLVLVTILCMPIFSGWLARSMMFPGSRRPLPLETPPEWGPRRLEVVDYATEDGIALKGVLCRAARKEGAAGPPPTLVYFHGNAESAADNVHTAVAFAREGYDIFIAEYRGYGLRPGSPHEAGLYKDGRAALAAVERLCGVGREDVILVGRSLGTGVASGLAAEGAGRGVVLLSPYTSMIDMAKTMVPGFLAKIAVKDVFDSKAALAKVAHKVLVVHGTSDRVIPVAQGKALAASLGDRAELMLLDGIGHNDLMAEPQQKILARIKTFLAALPK